VVGRPQRSGAGLPQGTYGRRRFRGLQPGRQDAGLGEPGPDGQAVGRLELPSLVVVALKGSEDPVARRAERCLMTVSAAVVRGAPSYPMEGEPVPESERHRNLCALILWVLQRFFAADPMVAVTGNLFVYYVPGDRRRHVSPDVFMVRGVPKVVRD